MGAGAARSEFEVDVQTSVGGGEFVTLGDVFRGECGRGEKMNGAVGGEGGKETSPTEAE